MKLRVVLLAMPVMVLALLVVSFFYARKSVDKTLNQLVWGSIGDAVYLNPILYQDGASGTIVGLVFDGLLRYDKDYQLEGALAESWEIETGEKPVITFHLRRGVKWHDGEPFSAEDVKFTFDKIMDEKTNTVRRSSYERVEELKVIDPFTVEVRYKEPYAPGLATWGMGILPKHILEDEDINTTSFNRAPVGTGPFRFEKWVSDEQIEVVAFDDHWEGRPLLDRIIYRIIPERALMEMELLTGGVDLAGVYPDQYERMNRNLDLEVFKQYGLGYTYIGYNLEHEFFKDKRVRQAFTYAINRKEIVDYILYGYGVEATGPFPNHLWYYNPAVKPYPFDPERAKALLAEAGWEDTDGDGILDRDGKQFKFTLITNSGNDTRKDVGVLVQRQLEEIGVSVTFQMYEWATFLEKFFKPRNFEVFILGWGLGVDPDQYELWHSSEIENGFNVVGYRSDEVDRLLEEGRREYDMEKRRTIYYRMHEIIAEDQPYTFLFVAEGMTGLARRFVVMREDEKSGRLVAGKVKMEKSGIMSDLIRWMVEPERPELVP